MNLLIIKDILEEKEVSILSLAEAIGMTPQNLHRCFKLNKIQAGDLEKIAKSLGVSIGTFFEENVTVSVKGSHNQLHSGIGNQSMSQSNETTMIDHLNKIIEEKNKIIADKDKLIDFLMNQNK